MRKRVFSTAVLLVSCIVLTDCEKKPLAEIPVGEKTIQHTDCDKIFFEYLEKLSQDKNQERKYFELIDKLADAVSAEAEKDPERVSKYIENIIALIPAARPTIALQIEEYASESVKKEMERLRQESNVAKLEELQNELADARAKLQDCEKTVAEKDTEIEKLQPRNDPAREVPVLIKCTRPGSVGFKIINRETQKFWMTSIPTGKELKAMTLPPGHYNVQVFKWGQVAREATFSVSEELSVEYEGQWYHGIFHDR